MKIMQSRRRFLTGLSLAGAAGLVGMRRSLSAEPPPETTTVRLGHGLSPCAAPVYAAEELLRHEGFTDIRYVKTTWAFKSASDGEIDFGTNFSAPTIVSMDAGSRITVVAGVHVGCFELFANNRIRSIADLKGKSVGIQLLNS